MQQLFDILGATFMAGFILLIIARSNMQVTQMSDEFVSSIATTYEIVGVLEIIEFDFYKIGYRADDNKIIVADSNEIVFVTDVISSSEPEGDGIVDSVKYLFDNSNPVSSSPNPDDYSLYRIVNNQTNSLIGRVTDFTLYYYDSSGAEIEYDSLLVQNYRNIIKSIKVHVEYQSEFAIDTNYTTKVWEKTIRPRNL